MKADQGGFAFGGQPLKHWVEGGELVEDGKEMVAVVEWIRDLRGEGQSLRQIAEVFTGEGLRSKRSEWWHPHTLMLVLDRAP